MVASFSKYWNKNTNFSPPPTNASGGYTLIWLNLKFIFIVPHLPRTQEEEYNTFQHHLLAFQDNLQYIPIYFRKDLGQHKSHYVRITAKQGLIYYIFVFLIYV